MPMEEMTKPAKTPAKTPVKTTKEPPIPREVLEAYNEAVNMSRQAMADRELEIAKDYVQVAELSVVQEYQKDEVARLKMLVANLAQFWKAVPEGMKGLEAGGEIEMNGTRMAVVENSPGRFTVKDAGKIRRFDIDATLAGLPAEFVTYFANRWFAKVPSSKVYMGTFYLMDRRGDRQKARALWDDAARTGDQGVRDTVEMLRPELDIPLPTAKE